MPKNVKAETNCERKTERGTSTCGGKCSKSSGWRKIKIPPHSKLTELGTRVRPKSDIALTISLTELMMVSCTRRL